MTVYDIVCGECGNIGFERKEGKDQCKKCEHVLTDEEQEAILKQAFDNFKGEKKK